MTPTTLLPDVLAVEAIEDFIHAEISTVNDICVLKQTGMSLSSTKFHYISLPPGSYDIIGPSKSLSEEQAAQLCPGTWSKYFENRDRPIYKDFADNIYRLDTALESLSSLFKSKGLVGQNYLLIRKLK